MGSRGEGCLPGHLQGAPLTLCAGVLSARYCCEKKGAFLNTFMVPRSGCVLMGSLPYIAVPVCKSVCRYGVIMFTPYLHTLS